MRLCINGDAAAVGAVLETIASHGCVSGFRVAFASQDLRQGLHTHCSWLNLVVQVEAKQYHPRFVRLLVDEQRHVEHFLQEGTPQL